MTNPEPLWTDIEGVLGFRAATPDWMSYSSLREIEACPRKWVLRRASYPAIWQRQGYPDLPNPAAIAGQVVHAALESVLREFAHRRCASVGSGCAVEAMRHLGGYSEVLRRTLTDALASLEGNPRVAPRLPVLAATLELNLPEMRERLQLILSRLELTTLPTRAMAPDARAGSGEVAGMWSEVELRSERLRWAGRADLIVVRSDECTIVDYKTGSPHESHADQLRMYALLWLHDGTKNPRHLKATRLVLSYPSHDEFVPAPTEPEFGQIEAGMRLRAETARSAAAQRPPLARPSVENCKWCPVRHMCTDYWQSPVSSELVRKGEGFGDVQLQVRGRHGPRSWSAVTAEGRAPVLLRTATETSVFRPPVQVRLLNVAIARAEDSETALLTMTAGSEAFEVGERSAAVGSVQA